MNMNMNLGGTATRPFRAHGPGRFAVSLASYKHHAGLMQAKTRTQPRSSSLWSKQPHIGDPASAASLYDKRPRSKPTRKATTSLAANRSIPQHATTIGSREKHQNRSKQNRQGFNSKSRWRDSSVLPIPWVAAKGPRYRSANAEFRWYTSNFPGPCSPTAASNVLFDHL